MIYFKIQRQMYTPTHVATVLLKKIAHQQNWVNKPRATIFQPVAPSSHTILSFHRLQWVPNIDPASGYVACKIVYKLQIEHDLKFGNKRIACLFLKIRVYSVLLHLAGKTRRSVQVLPTNCTPNCSANRL